MLRMENKGLTLTDVQRLYAAAQSTDTPLKPREIPVESVTDKEQQILATLEGVFKEALDRHRPIIPELVILASKLGHTATVNRYIEEHRGKLTLEDRRLYTQAMWWAIEQRPRNALHDQIFWMLLDAGADLDASVDCHETPLIWAIRHQSRHKFDVLLARGASMTIGNPLVVAASGGSYFVRTLLDKGINDPEKLMLALRRAAACNRAKNVSLLLAVLLTALAGVTNENNARVIDAAICDAFHAAAAAGSESAVKAFLSHGISANVRNKQGHTVLAMAAFHGQTNLVDLLLKSGADVNALSHQNVSPLMMAVVGRNRFAVDILLEAEGIRLDIRNHRGFTAEELADARGYRMIAGSIKYAVVCQLADVWRRSSPDSLSSSTNTSARFFSRPAMRSSDDVSVLSRLTR